MDLQTSQPSGINECPSSSVIVEALIIGNRELFPQCNPYIPTKSTASQHLKRKLKELEYNPNKASANQPQKIEHQNNILRIEDVQNTAADELTNQLSLIKTNEIPQNSKQVPKSNLQLGVRKDPPRVPVPQWHASWQLSAVISGHLGWVRSLAFDPSNEWFVSGSSDRTIKVWDFAKCCAGAEGGLKLTLTGHVNAVRALAVSPRHPYLFSAGEDKQVKCWDLEYNKVIRNYHGHLSAVFCLGLHPILDILITGGRDSVARVWDMRTKHEIHVLGGHSDAVGSLIVNGVDPQVITGSHDSTVKLWDLAAGKCMSTLTQHKKAVRSMALNPKEFSFISGAADNIKKWQCRDGRFLKNFSGHNAPINSLSVNEDGVVVSCGDNGSIHFWDYETGYCFQKSNTIVQPGSLDAESGIYVSEFDLSGSRLLTGEADKSIKIWKENPMSTEDSDPIDIKIWTKDCLALKRF